MNCFQQLDALKSVTLNVETLIVSCILGPFRPHNTCIGIVDSLRALWYYRSVRFSASHTFDVDDVFLNTDEQIFPTRWVARAFHGPMVHCGSRWKSLGQTTGWKWLKISSQWKKSVLTQVGLEAKLQGSGSGRVTNSLTFAREDEWIHGYSLAPEMIGTRHVGGELDWCFMDI